MEWFFARPPSLPAHPSVPLPWLTHRYSKAQPCNLRRAQSPARREGREPPRFFEPSLKIARKFKADIQGEGTRKPAKLLTQPPAIAAILSACADSSADRAGAQASSPHRFQERCRPVPILIRGAQSPAGPRSIPVDSAGVRGARGRSCRLFGCHRSPLEDNSQLDPRSPVHPSRVVELGCPARSLSGDSLLAAC